MFQELKATFEVFSKIWFGDYDEYNTMFRFACAVLNIKNHPTHNATLEKVTIPIEDSTTDDRDPFRASEPGSDEEDNPTTLDEFLKDLDVRFKSSSFKRVRREYEQDQEASDIEQGFEIGDVDFEEVHREAEESSEELLDRQSHPGLGYISPNEEQDMSEADPPLPVTPMQAAVPTTEPSGSPAFRSPPRSAQRPASSAKKTSFFQQHLHRVHKARSPSRRSVKPVKKWSPN